MVPTFLQPCGGPTTNYRCKPRTTLHFPHLTHNQSRVRHQSTQQENKKLHREIKKDAQRLLKDRHQPTTLERKQTKTADSKLCDRIVHVSFVPDKTIRESTCYN